MLAACVLTLGACAGRRALPGVPWGNAQQMIVVVTTDWDATTGELHRFSRADPAGDWHEVGDAVSVSIGRAGSAWGLGLHPPQTQGPRKREGDGRAPAGVFALGAAFGYAAHTATALPYQAMDQDDYCIDVPASPLYNRIVDAREVGKEAVAGSTEPMRRDLHAKGDPRYRLGFVIEHNRQAQPGAGSCIFAHLWRAPGEPTAGCTAMAEGTMAALLEWLEPQRRPAFVLLPRKEYARLRREWALPDVAR